MDPQVTDRSNKEFERARREMASGHVLAALSYAESALKGCENAQWFSLYGFCIAKERGHLTKGFEYCRKAIEFDSRNPDHFLYLAKIHLLAKEKESAISALRQGLGLGVSQDIINLLDELGIRKPSILKCFDRNHPLNKYLGMLLRRLGI